MTSNPLDLERIKEYCERNRDLVYLPAAVEEIERLRAVIKRLRAALRNEQECK